MLEIIDEHPDPYQNMTERKIYKKEITFISLAVCFSMNILIPI